MDDIGLIGLFCGTAVLGALGLTVQVGYIDRREGTRSLVLAAIFLAVAVRLAKSIWYFVFYEQSKPGMIAALVALALFGPLTMIYLRMSRSGSSEFTRLNFIFGLSIILVFGVLGALNLYRIADFGLHITALFWFANVLSIAVLLVQLPFMILKPAEHPHIRRWNAVIYASMVAICVVFMIQHYTGTRMGYALGASGAAAVLFVLMILIAKTPLVFESSAKPDQVPINVLNAVKRGFEDQKAHLAIDLSLNDFAARVEQPAYRISQAVKSLYGLSFPETVKQFRIEEAQRLLTLPETEVLTMEAIAADAGFKSPSAFYKAFKKHTGTTPAAFRKSGSHG